MPEDLKSNIVIDTAGAKANIASLNREIRVLESSFKATSAGMDDWTTSAQGNEERMKTLTGVMDAQRKKITSLEAVYKSVAQAQGEDSREAQTLAVKINNEKAALAANQKELDGCSKRLEDMGNKSGTAGDKVQKLGGILKTGLKSAASVAGSVLASVGAAAFNLGKQVVESYAEYEQAIGGVDKLYNSGGKTFDEYSKGITKSTESIKEFQRANGLAVDGIAGPKTMAAMEASYKSLEDTSGDAYSIVIANANAAYATAGMSATEYMETITSFSAALISSLDGDTVAAAEYADKAIISMSDNASTFGTDISSIQAAYTGFAKGNFTMLDNLNLGYSGTKQGMEDLLAKATEISGVEFSIDSYSDVIDAIAVIQDDMGIAGATAAESAGTISGSINSLTAAWSNMIVGLGVPDSDMETLTTDLTTALSNVINNVTPILNTIVDNLPALFDSLAAQLPILIPPLVTTAVTLIGNIAEELPTIITAISDGLAAIDWLTVGGQIIDGLILGFETAVTASLELISNICSTIWQAIKDYFGIASPSKLAEEAGGFILDGLLSGMLNVVSTICEGVKAVAGQIWDAIKSIFGFGESDSTATESEETGKSIAQGIGDGLTGDDEGLKTSVQTLCGVIFDELDAVLGISDGTSTAMQSYGSLMAKGIADGMSDVGDDTFYDGSNAVLDAAKTAFDDAFGMSGGGWFSGDTYSDKFKSVGKAIDQGIANGIKDNVSLITSAATAAAQDALDAAKKELGIASPSKVARDIIGKNFSAGIARGIESGVGEIEKSIGNAAASMTAMTAATTNNYSTTVNASVASDIDIDKLAERLAARNRRMARGVGVFA